MARTGIIVTSAYTQHGWDPCDHLIDDRRMAEIVGRRFETLAQAMRAARARADSRGYAAVEYVVEATGEAWIRGDEPTLPGRPPLSRFLGRR